jgi:glucokinase
MAGLGEAVYGSGKEFEIVAYLTISTGIGGARIVNKLPDEKKFGFEPGHQFIQTNFNGNSQIELESLVSGKSIKRIYGSEPQFITDSKSWDEINYYVACGVYNTMLFWSPDVIVLGGSTAMHLDLDLIEIYLKKFSRVIPKLPAIKKSQLGHTNGLLGALYLLDK